MYRGRRRTLVNGAVSEPVEASSGIPAGCGELKVSVRNLNRKYVDDMVLSVAARPGSLHTTEQLSEFIRQFQNWRDEIYNYESSTVRSEIAPSMKMALLLHCNYRTFRATSNHIYYSTLTWQIQL
eukprot:990069-Amphidinium_carterae.2